MFYTTCVRIVAVDSSRGRIDRPAIGKAITILAKIRRAPRSDIDHRRHALEVLALGTGVGIVGLNVIILIVVLIQRIL